MEQLEQLRALKQAVDEGFVKPEEYSPARRAIVAQFGQRSSSQESAAGNGTFGALARSLGAVASVLQAVSVPVATKAMGTDDDGNDDEPVCDDHDGNNDEHSIEISAPTPKKQRRSTSNASKTLQPKIFEGFKGKAADKLSISLKLSNGTTVAGLTPASIKRRPPTLGLFQCKQCDFRTNKKQALTNHERTHGSTKRGLLHISGMELTPSQQHTANKVMCTFIARDLIRTALDSELFQWSDGQHWCSLKEDGRKNNRGSRNRQPRSYGFKKRIILDKELLMQHHPDLSNTSEIVADMYLLDVGQVNRWYKDRTRVMKVASNRDTARQSRIKMQKGRFYACEQALIKEMHDERAKGKPIGPRWLRARMLQLVRKQQPPGWRLFSARQGWLWRCCRRNKICVRRKTNIKRKPIEFRLPFLMRWFAAFRHMLLSYNASPTYAVKWSIFPPEDRWSLDSVPFQLFDICVTYEKRGARAVHIAANSSSDSKRFCTLQILCRNRYVSHLPRYGQPRITVCFRGKGLRISRAEMDQYHPAVHVMWDPKAWFGSETTNRYVTNFCSVEIPKAELKPGTKHLMLTDNLGSQTERINPQFNQLLLKLCNCVNWNLLAGCTDEIQVVDAGLGALVKKIVERILMDWLMNDANWEEWTSKTLPATRKRVLITQFVGQAWDEACGIFPFQKVFNNTGTNLTADGSNDHLIKLEKVESFSFSQADLERDPKTGQLPPEAEGAVAEGAVAEGAEGAAVGGVAAEGVPCAGMETDDSDDAEEISGDSASDSEGGCTSDEAGLEGANFECPSNLQIYEAYPAGGNRSIIKGAIHHRYDVGWLRAVVRRRVTASANPNENMKYAVVFDDTPNKEYFLTLYKDDYGPQNHWVLEKERSD